MKYEIKRSCGHTETIDIYGPGADRERKAAWYANGICTECYKAAAREEEKAKGLVLTLELSYGYMERPVIAYFAGDTMPYKDKIKASGYQWGYAADDKYKSWAKRIAIEDMEDIIAEAKALGATTVNKIGARKLAAYQQWRDGKLAEIAADMAEIGPKPARPDYLPAGRWNGTIYGGKGNRAVYVGGNKINLTDDQAAELEDWHQANTAWTEAKDKIYRRHHYDV